MIYFRPPLHSRGKLNATTSRAAPATAGSEQVKLYARCRLPTEFGLFDMLIYRSSLDASESVLIRMGELTGVHAPFVRVHSECYTGEVLGSLKCDCREQLRSALRTIAEDGVGAVVYLRQEGRGIGLGNKIRAYAEQDNGADTVQANQILGFPTDLREFHLAAAILLANDVDRIRLNTNNPEKVTSLEQSGITIEKVVPSITRPNPHNRGYLRTKLEELGHAGLRRVVDSDGRRGFDQDDS